MGVTYQVVGLKELQAKLEALPVKLARRVLRPALQEAGAVIQQEAGVRAPRDTGKLTTDIVVDVVIHNDLVGDVKIGPAKSAFWGMFSELGTAPHQESSPRGTAPFMHPGEPARPWLRPAMDTKKEEALQVLANNIRLGLEEMVGK